MTGPEHYRQTEAEHRIAAQLANCGDQTWRLHMASAQLHATLACRPRAWHSDPLDAN